MSVLHKLLLQSFLFILTCTSAAEFIEDEQSELVAGCDAKASSLLQTAEHSRLKAYFQSKDDESDSEVIDSLIPKITNKSSAWDRFWYEQSPTVDAPKVYEAYRLHTVWHIVVPLLWIALVALLPFLAPLLEKQKITNVEKTLGAISFFTIMGGMYLFCCVIEFTSAHWKNSKVLTPIECVYFMATCLSTVGYGDITPLTNRGKIVVGFYIVIALFIVSFLLSQALSRLLDATQHYEQDAIRDLQEQAATSSSSQEGQPGQSSPRSLLAPKVKAPSCRPVLSALAVFSFFAITWAVFIHYHPGENKIWADAIYNSLVTMSSVGFGALTPVTPAGFAFASFWMIFGTAALAETVGKFGVYLIELKQRERLREGLETAAPSEDALKKVKILCGDKQSVSEAEYIFACLWSQEVIKHGDIKEFQDEWAQMKPQNGTVPLAVIKQGLDQHAKHLLLHQAVDAQEKLGSLKIKNVKVRREDK
eukprot:TRINITY_DN13072_c0_g1_i1.p1 TRINITY_DN13072_c0_g1~~TRINITY_DN13072_c0_g1_i1.p1  ORF type:complete len:477 (-),score=87.11 TRINITY_DN13072_c0_g1_i1:334-1764(-)